jgi:hypothetical protein
MLLARFVIRKLLCHAAITNAIAPSSVSFDATFGIVQMRLDKAPGWETKKHTIHTGVVRNSDRRNFF